MKLASERGINRTLRPIDRRGKNVEFPYKFDDNLIVTQPWNMKNFMALDIISNILNETIYEYENMKIPKNPYNEYTLKFAKLMTKESIKNITVENICEMVLIIKDRDLFKKYKPLLKYNSKQLYTIFKKTSECMFKLKYPIRVYNLETEKYETETYDNFNNDFENFFDIEIIDENNSGSRIHGLTYKITFNTCLSRVFFYNIRLMNFDWMDFNFYSLKNITQLLFRKYLLTNRRRSFEIEYDDFRSVLGLNIGNITTAKKTIELGFNELKKLKLIKSWRFGDGGRRDLIYYECTKY